MPDSVTFAPPVSSTAHAAPASPPGPPAHDSTSASSPTRDTYRPRPEGDTVGSTASRLNRLRQRPGSHYRPQTPPPGETEPLIVEAQDKGAALFRTQVLMQIGGLGTGVAQDWKRVSDGIGDGAMGMMQINTAP